MTRHLAPAGSTEAIWDLVHRYARLVRDRRGEECRNLFADDAYYEIREADPLGTVGESSLRNRLEGSQAIADYVGASGRGTLRLFPIIHNLMVEVSDDVVRSNCLMISKTFPAGNEVFGCYDDTYVQHGGIWLFASRTYTILEAPWTRTAS